VVEVAVNLFKFKQANVFQSGIIAFMTGMFAQQVEIEKLGKLFKQLDLNKDGFITYDELE
jgi:Ca2+-binding EF-hand superfamily protein